MSRLCVRLAFALGLVCSATFGQSWTANLMDHTAYDFGTIARGTKAEHTFMLRNTTAGEIHIAGIRSSCGCTQVRLEDEKWTIQPGESASIVAAINSSSYVGAKSATITVAFDRPAPAEVQLHVNTYIRGDVLIQPGNVQFGAIPRGKAVEKQLQVTRSGRSGWQVLDANCVNPHVTCKAIETHRDGNKVSYEIQVRLDETVPAGYLRDHVILVTNEQRYREIPLPIEAHVLADVSVSPASLFLGVVQPGEEVSRQLVVRGNKPFRIKQVWADGPGLTIHLETSEEPKAFYLVPVKFQAGRQPGKTTQTIRIETDLDSGEIVVPAFAVVAAPEPRLAEDAEKKIEIAAGRSPDVSAAFPQAAGKGNAAESTPGPASGRFPILQRLFGHR